MELGIERLVGEVGADELLCFPHNVCDGDGHSLLPFLEQPSMELVLHSFELADRTGTQAQALARNLRLLSQLNDQSTPPGEYILRDLDVTSDILYRSTVSLLQIECILNNLTLLEHRITLAVGAFEWIVGWIRCRRVNCGGCTMWCGLRKLLLPIELN